MLALPILAVLPELKTQLSHHTTVLLSAEPGAGKTTAVPLALLSESWLTGKILMLEPRRMAARNAAQFMAKQLNEEVGQTIGYRIRLESKISAQTRIEVVTEGILTHLLHSDSSLSGYSLIIFDEFHERNLHSDLGLALALSCQALLRDDLKILIMSATLNGQDLSRALKAPLLQCPGKSYALQLQYRPQPIHNNDLISHCYRAILEVLNHPGDILVFLPGRKEIERLAEKLQENHELIALPLHSMLNDVEQKRALAPQEKRKVILATNIAESALTIDGVRIVIDSGLERRNEFHLSSGLNELVTGRIAKASCIQRAGRAARQADGLCVRLYSESQYASFDDAITPEILHNDLAPLLLELHHWGVAANELFWLTPPTEAALNQAQDLLIKLGMIDPKNNHLTEHGKGCAQLNLEPRLAHALYKMHSLGQGKIASEVLALLQEYNKGKNRSDDFLRLWQNAKEDRALWQNRIQPLAQSLLHSAKNRALKIPIQLDDQDIPALTLALVYPDRIAQRRKNSEDFYLSNGRGATLKQDSDLIRASYLIGLELSLNKSALVHLAIELPERLLATLESISPELFSQDTRIGFQENGQYLAYSHKKIGTLILESQKLPSLNAQQWQSAWRAYITEKGLSLFTWDDAALQIKNRLHYAYSYLGERWPKVDDASLLDNLDAWLLPLLQDARHGKDLAKISVHQALENLLDWSQKNELERLLPTQIKVPSGSLVKIDYQHNPPVLAVKLQEMFGYEGQPAVLDGKLPLLIHLLSPAQRPLQVTADLPHFWRNTYQAVRKDMRGRYPKHPWPEDPLQATATKLTKNKINSHP
ncbi:MAG: ATP-dependent helicase HrpB [Pseudomonadota bacterium]